MKYLIIFIFLFLELKVYSQNLDLSHQKQIKGPLKGAEQADKNQNDSLQSDSLSINFKKSRFDGMPIYFLNGNFNMPIIKPDTMINYSIKIVPFYDNWNTRPNN